MFRGWITLGVMDEDEINRLMRILKPRSNEMPRHLRFNELPSMGCTDKKIPSDIIHGKYIR